MKNIKALCTVDSIYALFLYFIITGNSVENTFFIFSDRIPLSLRLKLGKNYHLLNVPKSKYSLFHYLYHIYSFISIPLYLRYKKLLDLPVYGFDFLEWSNPILNNYKEFYLIEDGLINYTGPEFFLKKYKKSLCRRFLIKHFDCINLPLGLSDKVKKIYLTGIQPIPKEIIKKTELIDINKLWNKLDINKKKSLKTLFLSDYKFNVDSKRKILLLTQCWSEDKILSEKEKISLYKYIIDYYGEKNIILKTHPRETTDYKLYFKDLEIISSPVPLQLLSLICDLKIETAISINSTSIFAMDSNIEKKIIYPSKLPKNNIYGFLIEKCKGVLK